MSITLAQITDTHLLDSPEEELRGIKTWYSLQAVLATVKQLQPDHLLLTGDLAHVGSAKAYQHLLNLITPLKLPVSWLPGNHDCLKTIKPSLDHPLFLPPQSLKLGNWQLITLSVTAIAGGYGEGYLSVSSLAWLKAELQAIQQPVLIALHHHPLPTGIDWVDQMGLVNNRAFLEMIDSFPQVKVVVFGHIHHAFHHHRNGVDYYGCPSTGNQVIPDHSSHPHLDQPGFRQLHLHPNGDHEAAIHRVKITAK